MTQHTHDPSLPTTERASALILIPGHWLGAWAWDEVRAHLTAADRDSIALTLPGLDARDPLRAERTLAEQAAAILDAVLAQRTQPGSARRVAIVAHSGANAPVSLVLDRHPELVDRVIWVDSGPVSPGAVFAPGLPDDVTALPLPPFDELTQQASLEGMSIAAQGRFRERAVPEPGPVLREAVSLANPARRDVPTTLVCCSISSVQVRELAAGGHPMFAEVAALTRAEFVDLPTGHWPMWSRPAELAAAIDAAA